MIPEMLQTLFGYTATDAGLRARSGRRGNHFVGADSWCRIVPRIGAKRLLGASFTIAAFSFFYYAGLTTDTDYSHFAFARAFQGFGYAFMFVPVSQLAYSYLPRNKNNKGSSLTNLCRNWGGVSASRSRPQCWRGERSIIRACWSAISLPLMEASANS